MELISNFVTNEELHSHIERVYGKIVYKFSLLHLMHEKDNYGYIIEADGRRFVLLSNNDELYESTTDALQEKISEYYKAILDTKKAITLLNGLQ